LKKADCESDRGEEERERHRKIVEKIKRKRER
jgi:hypothetical protein